MEDSEPPLLRSAFRNYLNSRDSGYQCISGNAGKCERCIFILKTIIWFSSAFVGYILIIIYSKFYSGFFINLACFILILLCLFLLLFGKYVNWRSMFDLLRRIFCCPWSCLIVPIEDQGSQTEEYAACQPAALHNAIDEQAVCQLAAQHDASEERTVSQPAVLLYRTEEQTALFAFRKYLSPRIFFSLGRIFCCPRSSYPTVSTEDLGMQTEEYAACQLAAQHDTTEEQTVYQSDRTQELTAFDLDALQTTSEDVFTKLQIEEQRFLQYLLSSTEDQESPSNE